MLHIIAKGLTDARIAEQLVTRPSTVNTNLKAIYGKIQVSSRSAPRGMSLIIAWYRIRRSEKVSEQSDRQIPEAPLTKPAGFSREDWLLIDEALQRAARLLRKIEREGEVKRQAADGQAPAKA